MSNLISAIDILEDILTSLINGGAHFFTIYLGGFNYGHVSYSRNFGGGAFQGAFRYRYVEDDMKFILDAIIHSALFGTSLICSKMHIHKPSRIRKDIEPDTQQRRKKKIAKTEKAGKTLLIYTKWKDSGSRNA